MCLETNAFTRMRVESIDVEPHVLYGYATPLMAIPLESRNAIGRMKETTLLLKGFHLLSLPRPVPPRGRQLTPPFVVSASSLTISWSGTSDQLIATLFVGLTESVSPSMNPGTA